MLRDRNRAVPLTPPFWINSSPHTKTKTGDPNTGDLNTGGSEW